MTRSDLNTILDLLGGLTLSPSEAAGVLSAMHISVSPDSTATVPVVVASPVLTTPSPSVLTPPDLPVTTIEVDGQTIYQKTYKNKSFEVPVEDLTDGPFYVITKGYRIGIFEDWGVTSDAVTRVGSAVFCKVDTMEAAIVKMLRAIDNQAVKVLEKK